MKKPARPALLAPSALVLLAGVPGAQESLWADLDADRLEDLVVLTPGRPDAVLRNLGDGTFRDATAELGLDGCISRDVVLEDADGDGRVEVLRVTANGFLRLHRSTATGVYADFSQEAGLAAVGGVARVRWLDYDRDGRRDLYVESEAGAPRIFHALDALVLEAVTLELPPPLDTVGLPVAEVLTTAFDSGRPVSSLPPSTMPAATAAAARSTERARRHPLQPADLNLPGALPALAPPPTKPGAQPLCAHSLADQAQPLGSCIEASSTPALGRLYPLSTDFFVDPVSRKVGIGTTNPNKKLTVKGSIRVTGSLRFDDADRNGVYMPEPDVLAFDTLTTERMRIDAQGNVGIGTPAPTARLQVESFGSGGTSPIFARTDRAFDTAITGINSDPTDSLPTGVGGEAPSELGIGVRGLAATDPGVSPVFFFGAGVSGSTAGAGDLVPHRGVAGLAFDTAGADDGVVGMTYSEGLGSGVLGIHNASLGTGPGVVGETHSAAASSAGVEGVVVSSAPGPLSAGVRGLNSGASLWGIGVHGSQLGTGWGVFGDVLGAGDGVRGTSGAGGRAVYADGELNAVVKSFVHPHPTDPAKEIRFLCLEGNESGTYFRGSGRLSGGRAVIEVPEDFRLVTEEEGLTVQLTAVGARTLLWVESKGLDWIVVRGDTNVEFDYTVNGLRAGMDGLETIRANRSFVPRERGVPFGAQYPKGLREILVDNGTLSTDFTPNEATALHLGWTLRDAEPVPVRDRDALRASIASEPPRAAAHTTQQSSAPQEEE